MTDQQSTIDAVMHVAKDRIAWLKKFSDDGQYPRIPGPGAGPAFEAACDFEAALEKLTATIDALRAEVEGWKEQHGRDSAELRRLCADRDRYRAEVEALRKRREWLPIESAPKDGTTIDVWAGNIRVSNVSWNEKAAEPYDDTGWCFDDWHTTYEMPCMTEVTPEPTHWMPLPEPPPMTHPCSSIQPAPWAIHKEFCAGQCVGWVIRRGDETYMDADGIDESADELLTLIGEEG